jgi:hypothetical protein
MKQSRDMYDNDPRFEGIVMTLARDVTKGGFRIEFAEGQENPQALEEAEALRKRLGLNKRVDDWTRLSLVDGDTFLEAGVSKERDIEVVTRKPTMGMNRNSNSFDSFDDPTRAFWYSDRPFVLSPPADALWFAEWQIIHARWNHDENKRYGRPLLTSGHKPYKFFTKGEEDLAIRRAVRAGMRYLHIVEGDESEIEAYRERNKPILDNPTEAAIADFFSNRPGGISAIQGDANLGTIDDLVHHIDTWWIGSPVPKALLGYGRDLNRDVLRDQKTQYDETLDAVKEWVGDQLIRPLLEMQWLLKGIVPEFLDYQITWPVKAIVTPEDILKAAQAVQVLRGLNVPETVLAMVLAKFLPGVDADMLLEGMEGIDSGRLAGIANDLAGLLGRQQQSEVQNEQ